MKHIFHPIEPTSNWVIWLILQILSRCEVVLNYKYSIIKNY